MRRGLLLAMVLAAGCAPDQSPIRECATESECGENARCVKGFCALINFEGVYIESPSAGARLDGPATVRVSFKRRQGATGKPPQSVTLRAFPPEGEGELTTLERTGDSLALEGTFTPRSSGLYTLLAESAETGLVSSPVSLIVNTCKSCEAGHECLEGRCVRSFGAIRINEPVAGRVGSSVTVTASLDRTRGARGAPPSQVELVVTPRPSGMEQVVALPLMTGTDSFIGSWTPADGAYDLVVRSPAALQPSSPVRVVVDNGKPTVTLTVEPARLRGAGEEDPRRPDAFHRDEEVEVRITSQAADLDRDSLVAEVLGIGAVERIRFPVLDATCTPAAPLCKVVRIPLWQPPLKALGGDFNLAVRGRDLAGNTFSSEVTLPVTRWRWAFSPREVNPPTLAPGLAVGARGTVYVAHQRRGLVALRPDGSRAWRFETPDVFFTFALSAIQVAGQETLLAAGADLVRNQALVWRLDDSDTSRTAAPLCQVPGFFPLASAVTRTKLASESTPITTLLVSGNTSSGGALLSVRLGAAQPCRTVSLSAEQVSLMAVQGDTLYVSGPTRLHSLVFDATTGDWKPRSGWPSVFPGADGVGLPILNGSTVFAVVGDLNKVVAIPAAGGMPAATASLDASPTFLLQSRDQRLQVTTQDGMRSLAPELTGMVKAGGPALSAPQLDSLGNLVGITGYDLTVLGPDGSLGWTAPGLELENDGFPVLDCNRRGDGSARAGRPGVIYLPRREGGVLSLFTDGAGLDPKAPWPKTGRDPGNTSDATVDLSSLACP